MTIAEYKELVRRGEVLWHAPVSTRVRVGHLRVDRDKDEVWMWWYDEQGNFVEHTPPRYLEPDPKKRALQTLLRT